MILAALLAVGLWRSAQPSPVERYVADALAVMDQGLHTGAPEWEKARRETLRVARGYSTVDEAHSDLKAAVTTAGGDHSSFWTPKEAAQRVEASHEAATDARPRAWKALDEPSIAVLEIPRFNTTDASEGRAFAKAGMEAIDRTSAECGWIVDLRGNTGGNLYPMLGAAAPFLPLGPVLNFEYPDGDRDTVEISDSSILLNGQSMIELPMNVPEAGADGPLAVVFDRGTASAGEGLALAFTGQDRVRSFGEPSAGYSTANTTTVLEDDALVVMTVAVMKTANGVSAKGGPIRPDVNTARTGIGDPIDRATTWLASACPTRH